MAYKSPRALHPRRLLDIVWGSVLNGTKTKIQKLNLGRSIRNGITVADFNEKIRSASPNIYVVDPKSIATIVFDAYKLHGHYEISELVTVITTTLNARVRESISMAQLLQIAGSVHSKMVSDITRASASKLSYISFRRAAAGAGAELRRLLNPHKITRISDPGNFIQNPGDKTAYLSYSFDRLKTELNAIISDAVKGFGKKAKVIPADFKIGSLVDAGHVGLYSGPDFVGINMPAQIIHGTIGKKFEEVEEAIGSIDTHVECGLRLNEKFSASGILLDLGFQFTVVMSTETNRSLWSNKESKALLEHVKLATKNELTEIFKSKIPDEALINLLSDVAVDKGIRASPTIVEYISDTITNSILGKAKAPSKSSSNSKLTSTKLPKTKSQIIRSLLPKKSSVSLPKVKGVQKGLNLANLQALLNQALSQQIKDNMNSPALINRTGRFAESVKVERISESRAGMISAFYSYMKSPYQTFEPGFAQGSNKRNPKTLISKSIREIASGLVGNRLRAISI